jgi:rubredoxin-NAD+ reductase
VIIMGAGFIGCEFANDLAAAGHAVAVVDPGARPLAALLPAPASAQLQAALSALGVRWHWGTTVAAVNAQAGGTLLAGLANGQELAADLVLSAVGLRADMALATAAGLRCERGIVVSAHLQTSADDVYALGDSAQYAHGRTMPYVMPILTAAKALAATLAGQRSPAVFPLMPIAIKTPALPLVVAPPEPGQAGEWTSHEDGVWQFLSPRGQALGFALAGRQTARRAEQSKLLQIAWQPIV